MVRDPYGREIKSVRISVTYRCNMNCIYCHKEGLSNVSEEMTPEEIERIVRIMAKYGISKVKITGGEPLVRDDIVEIVHRISRISGIKEVSMVTNGYYLEEYAYELKKAGLKRVNVSLDTLNPEKYRYITGCNCVDKVLRGIEKAYDAGLRPIKINVVLLKGINDGEIFEIIKRFSRDGFVVQLIELINSDDNFFKKHYLSLKDIEDYLEKISDKILIRELHARKRFFINGAEVETVRFIHNKEFCANCNRIRITPDGKFKPCLMRNDNLVDFLSYMRSGCDDKKLEELFLEAVKRREPFNK